MNSLKRIIILLSLIVLSSCGEDPEPLDELVVELNASNENPNYNTAFTLTWSSNASQCYASGPLWSGEKELSGSEEFTIKEVVIILLYSNVEETMSSRIKLF